MSDLKVDYDLLSEFETNLQFVEKAFEGLHNEVHGLDANQGWGSDDIRSAMGSFADDWSYHRSKLESSATTLLKLVTTTKGAFGQADQQLAQQLHSDNNPAPAAKQGGH
jgi:hypothetical protein